MREIKFRAWDTTEKRMRYENDVEGSKDLPYLLAVGFHGLPICINGDCFREDEIIGWNRDHNLLLMQYTGLKDKNGKEIYEGDIINIPKAEYHEEYNGVQVKWGEGWWYFEEYNEFGVMIDTLFVSAYDDECEVVGNIYENPELLREASPEPTEPPSNAGAEGLG